MIPKNILSQSPQRGIAASKYPNPAEPEPNFGSSAESVGALLYSPVRKTDEAGGLSVGEHSVQKA
jgi:hypothetical protein